MKKKRTYSKSIAALILGASLLISCQSEAPGTISVPTETPSLAQSTTEQPETSNTAQPTVDLSGVESALESIEERLAGVAAKPAQGQGSASNAASGGFSWLTKPTNGNLAVNAPKIANFDFFAIEARGQTDAFSMQGVVTKAGQPGIQLRTAQTTGSQTFNIVKDGGRVRLSTSTNCSADGCVIEMTDFNHANVTVGNKSLELRAYRDMQFNGEVKQLSSFPLSL